MATWRIRPEILLFTSEDSEQRVREGLGNQDSDKWSDLSKTQKLLYAQTMINNSGGQMAETSQWVFGTVFSSGFPLNFLNPVL